MEVRQIPNEVKKNDVPKKIRKMFGLDNSSLPSTHLKSTGTDTDKRVSVYFRTEAERTAAKQHFLSVADRRWRHSRSLPCLKLADENSRDIREAGAPWVADDGQTLAPDAQTVAPDAQTVLF